MDLKELWIGDTVKIKSNSEVGTFSGISTDGLAMIKTRNGIIIHASAKDLEIYVEPEKPTEIHFDDFQKPQKLRSLEANDDDSIDLHYDHLIQYSRHEQGHILDFQLEKCDEFISNSLEKNRSFIRIIYGKGEGVLKKAVDKLLLKYSSDISLVSAHFDGASVDVWFK